MQLLNCRNAADRKDQPKLLLGDLDQEDYKRLIEKDNVDESENVKLKKAYDLFTTWTKQLSPAELEQFAQKLRHSTAIIKLDVGEAKWVSFGCNSTMSAIGHMQVRSMIRQFHLNITSWELFDFCLQYQLY